MGFPIPCSSSRVERNACCCRGTRHSPPRCAVFSTGASPKPSADAARRLSTLVPVGARARWGGHSSILLCCCSFADTRSLEHDCEKAFINWLVSIICGNQPRDQLLGKALRVNRQSITSKNIYSLHWPCGSDSFLLQRRTVAPGQVRRWMLSFHAAASGRQPPAATTACDVVVCRGNELLPRGPAAAKDRRVCQGRALSMAHAACLLFSEELFFLWR